MTNPTDVEAPPYQEAVDLLVHGLLDRFPGPWMIVLDWTYEVRCTENSALVIKCPNMEVAHLIHVTSLKLMDRRRTTEIWMAVMDAATEDNLDLEAAQQVGIEMLPIVAYRQASAMLREHDLDPAVVLAHINIVRLPGHSES
jgi:hypothetical protein